MSKITEIAEMYKSPKVIDDVDDEVVEGNLFTDMVLQTKSAASGAFDKLAYLAGIKQAPADAKYSQLNTNSLSELIKSATSAGYDVEVVNI